MYTPEHVTRLSMLQECVSRIVCWAWAALMALVAACTASSVLSLAPAALSLLHTIAAMALTSRDWSHLLRRHRMLAVVCLRCNLLGCWSRRLKAVIPMRLACKKDKKPASRGYLVSAQGVQCFGGGVHTLPKPA